MIGFWRGTGKDKWEPIFEAPAFSTKHFFLSLIYFQKVVAICTGEKSAGDTWRIRLFFMKFQQAGRGRWRGKGGKLAKFIWVLSVNRCLFSPIQWLETRSYCKNWVWWKPSVKVGNCGFFVPWYQLGPIRVMISSFSPQVYRCLYLGENYCFAYWHLCAFF